MIFSGFVVFILIFISAESTDIAAVYENNIIYLKNVHSIEPTTLIDPKNIFLNLSQNFSYPVALTYDADAGSPNLFVSDLNNKQVDIFKLDLSDDVIEVTPVVLKLGRSTVETLLFDSWEKRLLWTDSSKHGIYSAAVTEDSNWEPQLVVNTNIYRPRGIAIDPCKRNLYWTERFQKQRTIEKYNLDTKKIEILKEASNTEYFQAIDYNTESDELIWAETSGDEESTSSCRILVSGSSTSGAREVISLERCYPFSLTSDREFIYWSDWARGGIMRVSRTDPSKVVKLVSTPSVKGDHGGHNGAFGIVNIGRLPSRCAPPAGIKLAIADDAEQQRDPNVNSVAASSAQSLNASSSVIKIHGPAIVAVLSATSILFLFTTLLLLGKSYCWNQTWTHGLPFSPKTAPNIVSPTRAKRHRTFGPPKTKTFDANLCSQPSDGVTIEIEDCCQMTLCDSPCYTSMKKEGRSYKSKSKSEDKKSLLNDAFDA